MEKKCFQKPRIIGNATSISKKKPHPTVRKIHGSPHHLPKKEATTKISRRHPSTNWGKWTPPCALLTQTADSEGGSWSPMLISPRSRCRHPAEDDPSRSCSPLHRCHRYRHWGAEHSLPNGSPRQIATNQSKTEKKTNSQPWQVVDSWEKAGERPWKDPWLPKTNSEAAYQNPSCRAPTGKFI